METSPVHLPTTTSHVVTTKEPAIQLSSPSTIITIEEAPPRSVTPARVRAGLEYSNLPIRQFVFPIPSSVQRSIRDLHDIVHMLAALPVDDDVATLLGALWVYEMDLRAETAPVSSMNSSVPLFPSNGSIRTRHLDMQVHEELGRNLAQKIGTNILCRGTYFSSAPLMLLLMLVP